MLATAGTLVAAEPEAAPEPARLRGELYLKLSTGLGLTHDSDLDLSRSSEGTDLTFEDVSWEDHSLEGPSARYMAVRFGYFFARRPWLGLAVDFLHYKVFAETERTLRVHGTNEGVPIDAVQPMEEIASRYDVSNGVNLLPVSAIARRRLKRDERHPDGRLQPYAGLGLGPTWLYTKSTVNGDGRTGPYEFGQICFQAIGGVQFHVGPRWDVFFEYKRTYTEADGSIEDGSSETELHSDHYTLGGGFHW